MMQKNISILSLEHPLESVAMRALFAVLFVFLCGYLYFVGASILNVIARKEASAHVGQLQTAIAGMEQKYFSLSQAVDPSEAQSLGLAPISDTQYVYRPGQTAAATIQSNEI